MDLLQTVRKEGSRGGVNFKWEDVKNDSQRENYLGHSLMAPVGRWQKGKDLNWYAKADDAEQTPEERAAAEKERKMEELRKVKEAEEDAMAKALGLPPPDRSANTIPLGKVNKALKEALDDGSEEEPEAKGGLGDDKVSGRHRHRGSRDERRRDHSRDRRRHRHRDDEDRVAKRRRKSRSRSREYGRERRHEHRHRSRSRSREHRRRRSRSRDRERDADKPRRREDYGRNRSRSRDRVQERRHRDRSRDKSRSRSPYRRPERRRESFDR